MLTPKTLPYLLLLLFFIPVVLQAQDSTNTQLREYKDMLDKGQITPAEYDVLVKKAKHPKMAKLSRTGYGSNTGYGNITEAGALLGISGYNHPMFTIKSIFGGRITPNFFIGGGAGFNIGMYRDRSSSYSRPLFIMADLLADFHYYVLQTRVSPFVGFEIGPSYYNNTYPLSSGAALTVQPSIGVRGYVSYQRSLGCSLGYRFNKLYGYNPPTRFLHFVSINFTAILW